MLIYVTPFVNRRIRIGWPSTLKKKKIGWQRPGQCIFIGSAAAIFSLFQIGVLLLKSLVLKLKRTG